MEDVVRRETEIVNSVTLFAVITICGQVSIRSL